MSERKVYALIYPDGVVVDKTDDDLTLSSLDETRHNVVSFLAQTNASYIDKWGIIHEVTAHDDRPFAWYFEIVDDCWEDVLGEAGALLDDSENKDVPICILDGISKVYDLAYSKVFPRKEKHSTLEDEEPLTEISVCLEEWSTSYPTGVIAKKGSAVTDSDYCESPKEFGEFFEEHSAEIGPETMLTFCINVNDLGNEKLLSHMQNIKKEWLDLVWSLEDPEPEL